MRRDASQEQTEAAVEALLVAQLAQGLCECLQDQQRHQVGPGLLLSEVSLSQH